ncbi:FAD-binding domain-containing protein [Aaosphaeria arxii CBS 175.79]|uniref:FAD-binding domain-containing protein n=1 Tax=Aaosphaeria arxii CBS 175.79 TaxID=1450172 RepID=A0A6A5XNF8_9PLEO|nr:FAD-binding domain-containing protein [Aaosphaeria arxii CBS 175.79]KAF2014429.1 FAD-binding domain-containing protein [Aaosphaeria arxii CBS 175.79]
MVRLSLCAFSSLLAIASAIKDCNPEQACSDLKSSHPSITFLPGDEKYTNETEVSWTASAWLKPACVFAPRNAKDLSFAVKTFTRTSTPFAMRGGGHMPIPDAANINSTGVLVSSSNLKTLQLSSDQQTMSIGPGPRWGDVFQYLEGTNRTVIGGRLAPVGVPGLLLGGGMSWYSYKHGQGSAGGKIKAYEAVLADGTIATVTAKSKYADLYWALQGGGNSFALITRFDLQTFYAETPLMADANYGSSNATRDAWLKNIVDFTNSIDKDGDTGAAVIPVARWGPNFTAPLYQTTLFYNGTAAPASGPFAEFINGTTLKALNDTSNMRRISLTQYGAALGPAFKPGGQSHGLNQKFHVVSTKATYEAATIVHDTFFSSLQEAGLANRLPGFFVGLAFNCITQSWATASVGAPQNMPQNPQFWIEQSLTWESEADTPEIEAWVHAVNAKMNEKLIAANQTERYTYLNDADKGQEVFSTYGEENLRKLQDIRNKYDPHRIFTDLLPGGFKVAHA